MDETSLRIINASMNLIMEKGYSLTTTKEIANKAGVNESTIFRKFNGKKDIVLNAMELREWNPDLTEDDFKGYSFDLKKDLLRFSHTYLDKVTPKFVKISLGLRCPELYEHTKEGIMQIPMAFKRGLFDYFKEMYKVGKVGNDDFEGLAVMFLSINFGFVFFKASFSDSLTPLPKETFIENSIDVFVNGIKK